MILEVNATRETMTSNAGKIIVDTWALQNSPNNQKTPNT